MQKMQNACKHSLSSEYRCNNQLDLNLAHICLGINTLQILCSPVLFISFDNDTIHSLKIIWFGACSYRSCDL